MRPKVFIWGEPGDWQNYVRALEAAGGCVFLSRAPETAEFCDALLLPGGGDLEPWRYGQINVASCHMEPERDRIELALIERFTAVKKPILGICRGIQTVNVYFGGTLLQDLPGHSAAGGTDRFHRVSTAPSIFRDVCGQNSIVNSAHHQALDALGDGLAAAQWAPDGTIEAVFHRELPIWAVQWHPERLPGKTGDALFRAFLTRCCP